MQDLKVIIKRLLLSFYRATAGKKPEKLILYRDGMSEGMFAEVQWVHIPQIIQACKALACLSLVLQGYRAEYGRSFGQGKGLGACERRLIGKSRLAG